jgi:hypothetical protein
LGIATSLSTGRGGKVMCDVEQAALAKAIADLKLTNANARGVRADVSLKAQL